MLYQPDQPAVVALTALIQHCVRNVRLDTDSIRNVSVEVSAIPYIKTSLYVRDTKYVITLFISRLTFQGTDNL